MGLNSFDQFNENIRTNSRKYAAMGALALGNLAGCGARTNLENQDNVQSVVETGSNADTGTTSPVDAAKDTSTVHDANPVVDSAKETAIAPDAVTTDTFTPDTLMADVASDVFECVEFKDLNVVPQAFNPSTQFALISYFLTKDSTINAGILNSGGNEIRDFSINLAQSTGFHSWGWTGINDVGMVVPDGIYTLDLSANDGTCVTHQTFPVKVDSSL